MSMTKKEEKKWFKENIKNIVEQHVEEGTYQEKQLGFNEYCLLIEELFIECLYDSQACGEKHHDAKELTDEDVEVFSTEFNINDYAVVSKTKLKATINKILAGILNLNKDGGKYVDFLQTTPETAIKGVVPSDHLLTKIEKHGICFFIKFINEEVTFTNNEDGKTKTALNIHKFMPVIGLTRK